VSRKTTARQSPSLSLSEEMRKSAGFRSLTAVVWELERGPKGGDEFNPIEPGWVVGQFESTDHCFGSRIVR
jgi:hypothetical protein